MTTSEPAHEESIDCPCMPTVEPVYDDDGNVIGLLFFHQAWDRP